MKGMNREKVKLLIELSPTVEDADHVIEEAGFKTVREKFAYLQGMFDSAVIGRYDDQSVSDDSSLEMDYYAILSAIINCTWEA